MRLDSELDSLRDNPSPVEELEELLERFSNVFPPQHCKMMEIKIRISKSFLKHQMDQDDVERKLEICEEILSVLSCLEPGMSEWRGHILYEKNWPAMMILQWKYQSKRINKKTYKKAVKTLIHELDQAKRCLEIERKNSTEGDICSKIDKSMENMKQLVANV